MNQEKIGKFIKKLRLKDNLSQQEFANKFGVSYQAVSKWETGKNIPDIAILKSICEEYNLSLDDFFDHKKKNNKLKIIIPIILIIIALISLLIFILINTNRDFEFKTLSADCTDFFVSGSVAYNDNKTSIYISHINYCGQEDLNKYKAITCTLFEQIDKTKTEIDSYTSNKDNITLEEFLKEVKFNINNHNDKCKYFSENSLFLEVDAKNNNGSITTYKIPLNLIDNC